MEFTSGLQATSKDEIYCTVNELKPSWVTNGLQATSKMGYTVP